MFAANGCHTAVPSWTIRLRLLVAQHESSSNFATTLPSSVALSTFVHSRRWPGLAWLHCQGGKELCARTRSTVQFQTDQTLYYRLLNKPLFGTRIYAQKARRESRAQTLPSRMIAVSYAVLLRPAQSGLSESSSLPFKSNMGSKTPQLLVTNQRQLVSSDRAGVLSNTSSGREQGTDLPQSTTSNSTS